MKQPQTKSWFPSLPPLLIAVFGIGIGIRLIALANIHIINPDGILYIYQAKAIASGQYHLLNQCQLHFLSLYPLLVALFQVVIPKWVLSAQLVSLVFGCGMLMVLYPLLRQFFNATTAQLTTLLIALSPVFVRYSVDAMRDSTFWFFFTGAMWLFVLHHRQGAGSGKSLGLLVGSSCLILLAAWSRIEGLILLPVSLLFLALAPGSRRPLRLLVFLLPELCLAGLVWLLVSHSSTDILSLIRWEDVARKFIEPVTSYQSLRAQLKILASTQENYLLANFLQNSYHAVWLTALGTIFLNALEAFFYPYVVFFVVGTMVACKQRDRRSELYYPLLILLFASLLLFAHALQTWIMTYRFIVLLILPASVLAGLGVEATIRYLSRRYQLGEKKAMAIVAAFIVAAPLVKDVAPIERDKAVYTEIGSRIEQLAQNNLPIEVAGRPSVVHMWIAFYANAATPGPVCHQAFTIDPGSMDQLKSWMQAKGIRYFLWEEARWKSSPFGRDSFEFVNDFEELGQWRHENPGQLILFRLKTPS